MNHRASKEARRQGRLLRDSGSGTGRVPSQAFACSTVIKTVRSGTFPQCIFATPSYICGCPNPPHSAHFFGNPYLSARSLCFLTTEGNFFDMLGMFFNPLLDQKRMFVQQAEGHYTIKRFIWNAGRSCGAPCLAPASRALRSAPLCRILCASRSHSLGSVPPAQACAYHAPLLLQLRQAR